NTVRCAMNDGGAKSPAKISTSAPTPNVTAGPTHEGRAGFAGAAGAAAAAGACCGGAAEIFGGGGGHVTTPSLTTVAPRITSSSMSTTTVPSFAGHMSEIRCRRFVAYIWLDCAGSRLGRSV